MTVQDPSTRAEVPPEVLAEAGVWVAKLHGPNRTAATERGFRQWLAASPAHARGFELATEVWEDSQNLVRAMPCKPAPRSAGRLRMAVAMAAMLALAVVGAIFYVRYAGIRTEVGEQRQLTLEDGTRVFLNTATHIVVQYTDQERRVRLDEGEALFYVAKRPTWPFVVTVGNHQIRALGTAFVVQRDDRRIAVTLVEGKVAVAPVAANAATAGPPSPAVQTLSPGERLTFVESAPPAIDRPVLEKVIAWRRGQVALYDTPLSDAIDEMNRYSRVELAVERPEAASLLVNGLFQAGDSESFAAAVAQTYGLDVVRQSGRILLAGVPDGANTGTSTRADTRANTEPGAGEASTGTNTGTSSEGSSRANAEANAGASTGTNTTNGRSAERSSRRRGHRSELPPAGEGTPRSIN